MNSTTAKVTSESVNDERASLKWVSIVIGLAKLQNVAARLRLSIEEKKDKTKNHAKEKE